ncbi:MAG: NAD-dependent epimerase/dehydratase family protein [Paracoccus sp. (in: a-proteobacteria)]|uniref:NAD-dependent epimerase/dehydratase family protein n=1 Tax=Paracoccus sp. TaxID=267 RepID=UPI0026DF80FA|nr:NAD-dependent epimerase/dehydratase family protein [Paracoccus sp. (in: a-proteobacteria)]MDO5622183.1 NAD-dependent epimerase/dehydratase family protein [Paracoccus sp. (in: a-proteobacteria)]
MPAPDRIALTGGTGLVGRAVLRQAETRGIPILAPRRADLDLADPRRVAEWLGDHQVDTLIHAAAKVGGIAANIADPTGFLAENIALNHGVLMGAHQAGVTRLLNLGSSCIYPRNYRQPLVETDLMAAPLEPTNEGYALSKIAALRLVQAIAGQYPDRHWRSLIPCNLFGIDDHFGSTSAHLIAAIITKVLTAGPVIDIWSSGTARREFLFADDLAGFILDSLPRLETLPPLMNTGFGRDYSVNEYYQMIADLAGWQGRFTHDLTRPEGMAQKLMDSSLARRHGWAPPDNLIPALRVTLTAARARLQT